MSFSVLHLSDLHFKGNSDKALSYPPIIARACAEKIRRSNGLVIIITGDIAYGGAAKEYEAAELFLSNLRTELRERDCVLIGTLMVPGNHDCALIPENTVRSIVIKSVVSDISQASDSEIISACVQPQENYFAFRTRVSGIDPQFDHPLWTEYEIIADGKPIRFSAINAAWMSRIPEVPGQLVFPTSMFENVLMEPATLRLALVHHPLNWYAQSSYHDLRKKLRGHCNAIFSGHEHTATISTIRDFGVGDNLTFEADALQPHSATEVPGFSLAIFDLAADSVEITPFNISRNNTIELPLIKTQIGALKESAAEGSELSTPFITQISNPGGAFIHPDRENIALEDLFVFPELRSLDPSDEEHRIQQPRSADSLLLDKPLDTRALVLSEEKGGKTSLLFALYKRIHAAGQWPLYIPAGQVTTKFAADIPALLSALAKDQYRDPKSFLSAPPRDKVALIDDLDHLKGGAKVLRRFLEKVNEEFSGIIATAARGFELQEILLPEATTALRGFRLYELTRFGHVLRHRLIRKWCENGNWNSVSDLDRDVHAAEELLNRVLGKNLAPALPMYLLILLQSWSQEQQAEIQNSSFARYYEYLMTRSLVRTAGVGRDEYDELFNYLSQLAWYLWESDIEAASYTELINFNRVFCKKFATVDLDRRLELLVRARLVAKRGDAYEFAYPYVFYFFLGRWLARHLEDAGVKTKVEDCARRLDVRKNASAILFLSYHSNNRWIIETIASALVDCMPSCKAIDLDKDICFINELADTSSRILIAAPDSIKQRRGRFRTAWRAWINRKPQRQTAMKRRLRTMELWSYGG